MGSTILRRVALFISVASLAMACAEDIKKVVKDELGSADFGFPVDFSDPNATYTAKLQILDVTRSPVKGATLTFDGTSYVSDDQGIITIENVKVNEVHSAAIVADGFMRMPVAISYARTGQGNANIVLTPVDTEVVMDSTKGGTVFSGTYRAMFEPNSFEVASNPGSAAAFAPMAEVPYTGRVKVRMAALDVSSQVFKETKDDGTIVIRNDITVDRIPPGFFSAVTADGIRRSMLPESLLAVEVTDLDGNPVKIANGRRVTIVMQLPALADRPYGSKMDILSYDETKGVWIPDGTCTIDEDQCTGTVSHFSMKALADSLKVEACLRMSVVLRKSVETANEGLTRIQRMEVGQGGNYHRSTIYLDYGIEEIDGQFLSDASLAYVGLQRYVRTAVYFIDPQSGETKYTYNTPWYLAQSRHITGELDRDASYANCDVIIHEQPESEGVSEDDPIEEIVDADADTFSADDDCDDQDAAVYPGAPEAMCNASGKDLNCDGTVAPTTIVPPAASATPYDIKQWNTVTCAYKRQSNLSCIQAGTEVDGNGVDEDCDGNINDLDGDGVDSIFMAGEDCDDSNANVNRLRAEDPSTPDDDDCDGVAVFDECTGIDDADFCGGNSHCEDSSLTVLSSTTECACDDGYEQDVLGSCILIDIIAPTTNLDSGPTGIVSSTSASFGFSCNESDCTFVCSLDGGAEAVCQSGTTYSSLAVGAHTFTVTAKDAANNVDTSPATRTWTIAPNTSLNSGPSGTLSVDNAEVSFTGTGSSFECAIVSPSTANITEGDYAGCTSPHNFSGLANASYKFAVRAVTTVTSVDVADPTPVTGTFTVNVVGGGTTPTTTILTGPSGTIMLDTTDVTFEGTNAEFFECALVSPSSASITELDYYPCSSPETLTGLVSGTYKFAVRAGKTIASDPFVEYDATPAEAVFTVAVAPPPPPFLAAGRVGGCLISGGNLYCWAGPYAGGTPLSVSATGDWMEISVGDSSQSIDMGLNYICGIRVGGNLYCWNNNSNGQLGLGNTTDQSSITQVGAASWTTVATGVETTCGIQTDTKPYCWGKNGNGQVGNGSTTDVHSPVAASNTTGWVDIELGGDAFGGYACGLKADGSLYCWGANGNGQLGLGDTSQRTTPQQVAGSGWVQVALGATASCGIKLPGGLWCWGSDSNEQMGNGPTDGSTNVPVQVGSDTDWAKVVMGNQHVCALRTNGTLWCWGWEMHEELGDGPGNTAVDTPTQVGVSMLWMDIVAGPDVSLGVLDGLPYGWGYDWSGQTGTGAGTGADCSSALGPDCVVPIPMAITIP